MQLNKENSRNMIMTEKFNNPLKTLAQDLRQANLGRTWKARTASNEKSLFQLPELDTIRRFSEKNFGKTMKKFTDTRSFRIRTGKGVYEYVHTDDIGILALKKNESEDLSNDLNLLTNNGIDEFYQDFRIGELLGEGAYSKVFKVLVPERGNFVAAKQISIPEIGTDKYSLQVKSLINEVNLLRKLDHENIVKYLGCIIKEDSLFIFMEYMSGGSLSSMLKQFGTFDEVLITKITKQIVEGLSFLHQKGIVHSDLKGGNILCDEFGAIKLADFGSSKLMEKLPIMSLSGSQFHNDFKGSLYWMAPELLFNKSHGRKVDIWSLGCILVEMSIGSHPWPRCSNYNELIEELKLKKIPDFPNSLSQICQHFIKKCCVFEKNERPSILEIKNHTFLL